MDSVEARYKNKKVYFNRDLFYQKKIRMIPIFKDFELKIPYSIREHFYSSKRINVLIPVIDLIDYL